MLSIGFFLSQNVRITGVKNWQQGQIDFNQWLDTTNLALFNDFITNNFISSGHDFILERVDLHPKAKLTDFISCNMPIPNSAIISLRAKYLLNKLNLPKHFFSEAKLFRNNHQIENKYFLFVWEGVSQSQINIHCSKCYEITDFVSKEKKYRNFDNLSEALNWVREKPLFRSFETICLPSFYNTSDLFKIMGIPAPSYISEKFILEYKELNLTGLDFETPILTPKIIFK